MVIDTLALIAILLREPDAVRFAKAIDAGYPRLLSAANFVEASIVIEARRGEAGSLDLDLLIHRTDIEIVPSIGTRPSWPESRGAASAGAVIRRG